MDILKKFNLNRKKAFGLALGGGSTWAVAHIGVLKILEKNRIKIDAIAGTSAGSIVASLYAFGIPIEKIESIALNLRLLDVFEFRLSRMGLSSVQKIKQLIKNYIGNAYIEDSLIPLFIPATDILELKPTLMQNMPVYEAVAASCAIPGIFSPVTIKGHMFVDGSLFADVPCKILKIKKMDIVLAVDLTDKAMLNKKPNSIFEVITKSIQGLINETRKDRLKEADIIISPDISKIGRFEFEKIPLIIKKGEEATLKNLIQIKKLLV